MNLLIVKYNAGNIQSVLYALERIGATAVVTDNVEEILAADKVIFPGVGEASTAMSYLRERKLDELIKNFRQPVLGVCLGMQLMCSYSEENDTECIDIFHQNVLKFTTASGDGRYKVPQMGWNKIYDVKSGLMEGVNEEYCYFVHGYYVPLNEHTI